MNDFYVYGLWETEDKEGLPFYIGKGKKRRMYEHFWGTKNNTHKDNKIKKLKRNGKNPIAKKIIDNLPEKKAYNIEYLLINIHYEELTNYCKNWGEGTGSGKKNPFYGMSHSEETKEKLSEANSGKNHHLYGKSHSKETIEKMRKSALKRYENEKHPAEGHKHSEEAKNKMSEALKGKNISKNERKGGRK